MTPGRDTRGRGVGRDSVAVLGATVSAAALTFLFVAAVARLGGPAERGVLAFLTPLPAVLSYAATLGLETAGLYFAPRDPAMRPALAAAAVLRGGVAGAALAAVPWALFALEPAWLPGGVDLGDLALALTATPAMTVQFVLLSTLLGTGAVLVSNLLRVAAPAVAVGAFGIVYALADSGDVAAIGLACWTGAQWAGAAIALLVGVRRLGWAPRRAAAARIKRALGFGLRAHAGAVADLAAFRVDALVLGTTRRSSELGVYAAAVNVAEVLLYLPGAVASVVLPAGAARPAHETRRLTARSVAVVVAAAAAAAGIGAAAAPPLIRAAFGPAFSGAVTPLRILLVAMIGMAARRVAWSGLAAQGRQAVASALSLATLAVVVVLDVVLIPEHGVTGAAVASLAGYWTGGILMTAFALRGPRTAGPPSPGPPEPAPPLD